MQFFNPLLSVSLFFYVFCFQMSLLSVKGFFFFVFFLGSLLRSYATFCNKEST
uniref:Uncharacterized protein n=1 Tax=Rhizophora mucronata TaxID=61149 RepID=A0A2P2QG09_RHIMU